MKLIATIVAALVAAALLPVSPATAVGSSSGDVVTSCSTTKRGDQRVTRVRWASGRETRRVNMTVRTRVFPGTRELRRFPLRNSAPRVVACAVRDDGTVMVRTKSRARYAFVPPLTDPTTPAPAPWGQWRVPVTLSAPGLDASWQLAEVAAGWNAALPAGLQLTVTDAPCLEAQVGCIPVQVEDLTGVVAEDLEHGDTAWGAAWPAYQDGAMQSCRIGLNADVPVERRFFIVAHEVGHCLGLPHWNIEGDNAWTIMTNGASAFTITGWDLAWLSAAYAAS